MSEKHEITNENPAERLKRLEREKKAADLRFQLAKLEAGEDVDLVESKPEPEEGTALGAVSPEGIVGGLGQLARLLGDMGVEDETAKAKDGSTIKFQRHAGKLRNVKLRNGRIVEADFTPDDWPPNAATERF